MRHFASALSGLVLLSAGFLLCAPGPAAAFAFTKQAGRGIVIFSTNYYRSDSNFGKSFGTPTTAFDANGRFEKESESVWVEYGITDDLNVIGLFDFAHLSFKNSSSSIDNRGLGNPMLALKYRFSTPSGPDGTTWSVQGKVFAPLRESGQPSLGYDYPEVELGLQSARGSLLLDHPIFVGAELAYRFRAGGAADEIHGNYGLGSSFNRWLPLLNIEGVFGLRNNNSQLAQANPQLAPDFDRVTIQPSLARQVSDHFWLHLVGALDIAGRNTGQGKEIKFGIWYTF